MSTSSPEYVQTFFSEMTEEQWQHIWKIVRLVAYRRYGWLQKRVTGLDIEGVIQEAILDTYTGKRYWPVDKVSFITFICQTVRSKISHIVRQEKKKLYINATSENSESEESSLKELSVSPDHDSNIRYTQLCSKLIAIVNSDPILIRIAELLIETQGDIKSEEMADILGLKKSEVSNALKRLRRMTRVLLRKE